MKSLWTSTFSLHLNYQIYNTNFKKTFCTGNSEKITQHYELTEEISVISHKMQSQLSAVYRQYGNTFESVYENEIHNLLTKSMMNETVTNSP